MENEPNETNTQTDLKTKTFDGHQKMKRKYYPTYWREFFGPTISANIPVEG